MKKSFKFIYEHFLRVVVLLFILVGANLSAQAAVLATGETITFILDDSNINSSDGWNGSPFIYAWDSSDNKLTGDWPGTKIPGKSYTFVAGQTIPAGVIFSAEYDWGGNKGKTADIKQTFEPNTIYTIKLTGSFSGSGTNRIFAHTIEKTKKCTDYATTIYFKNTVGWCNVYAYLYDGEYWGDNGSGSKNIKAGPIEMDLCTGSGTDAIYRVDLSDYNLVHSGYISFTEEGQKDYDNFHNTKAAYRGDLCGNNKMFVPNTTSNATKNGTVYYSSGSWETYSGTCDAIVEDEFYGTMVCDANNTTTIFWEKFTFNSTPNGDDSRTNYSVSNEKYTAYVPSNYDYVSGHCTAMRSEGTYAMVINSKNAGCYDNEHGKEDCNCENAGSSRWFRDITGNTVNLDPNIDTSKDGMLLFNCGNGSGCNPDVLYECIVNDICPNTFINFGAYITAANTGTHGNIDVKAEFRLYNADDETRPLAIRKVDNVPLNSAWQQISAMFNSGSATRVKIQLVNKAPSGQGNDLLLDDITFSVCTPKANLVCSNGTEEFTIIPGQKETLTASIISGVMENPYYLWQYQSNKAGWMPIGQPEVNKTELEVIPEANPTLYRVIIANTAEEAINIASQGNPSACGMYAITNTVTANVTNLGLISNLSDGSLCADGVDKNTLTLKVTNPLNVAVTGVKVAVEIPEGVTAYNAGTTTVFTGFAEFDLAANGSKTLTLDLKSTAAITASQIKSIKSYIAKTFDLTWDSASALVKASSDITVNPVPTAKFAVASENICKGSTTTGTNVIISNGSPNYTLTIGGTNYTATTSPYLFAVNPTSTTTYTLTKVMDAKGCYSTPTSNNTVSVNVEEIKITTHPASTSVCVGAGATFSVVASGVDKYQWQVSSDNSNWNNISGATASTYTISATTANDNNKYYRVVVSKDGGKCEQQESNSAMLTVKTTALPNLTRAEYKECATSGNVQLSTLFSGAGLKFYSDAALTNQVTTFSASEVVTGKKYYATQTINGCTSAATEISVTVLELPKLTLATTDKNAICGTENNSKATLTYKFEGGKAPYILSVQRTEDGGVTETITPSNLSATGTYTLQPTTKTTYKFTQVEDANGCVSKSTSGLVDDVVIDVKRLSISSNLNDESVCADKKITYTIGAEGDDIKYQWYQSTDNGASFNKVGTNSNTYTTGNFAMRDKKQYKVVVSQNPEVCSSITSAVSKVTVKDCSSFELVYTSDNNVVCKEDQIELKLTLSNNSDIDAANVTVNISNIANQYFVSSSSTTYNHVAGTWTIASLRKGDSVTLTIILKGTTVVKDVVSVAYISKSGSTTYTETTTQAKDTENITVKGITAKPSVTNYAACPEVGMLNLAEQVTSDKSGLVFYTTEDGLSSKTQADKNAVGTTSYWVTNTKTGECESERTKLDILVYPQPTALISGSATICKGESTDLSIALTGKDRYYIVLSNGDAVRQVSGPSTTMSVSPTATTTYTLDEVRDGNGCYATLSGNVKVVVNDKAEISISAPEPICAGDPLDLTNKVTIVTNGSTVTNGNWYLDDAIYTEGSSVPYEKNGAILKYKATSSCGGIIESTNSFAITVKAQANITITAPADLCIQDPLQLQAPTINYNGSTVSGGKWYLDGEEYNGADLVYKDEAYTLQYKANSSCGGETKSNEVTFKVKEKPTINLTEVDLGELCAGTELDLPTVTTKENNSTISSQGWLLETSSITSPIDALSTDVHDGKTITYTATNECGTTKVDYTTLSVKDCADFTLTFDLDNSNPCFEDEITLTATITNNGGSDLSNVVLSLQGPNAQASVTSSTSGDIVSNYSAGVWTIPTFTSKATATLTIKFSAQASEELKIYVSGSNGVSYASYAESPAKDTEELVVKEISDNVEISDNYIMCPTESSSTMFLSDFVISNQDGLKYFDKNADGTYTALTSEPAFDTSLEFASHTYYITNTETGKCESTTPTPITIEIYKPVKASISGLSPLCSGEISNVNIALEGTPEFTVVYNNGTADITQKTSETTLNIAESLSSTTTYKLVSVTDINNCSAYLNGTEFVTVTVNPRPELVSFEIEDSDDIICEGESTNLKATFTGTAPFTFKINGEEKTSDANEWSMTISDAKEYVITDLSDANCSAETILNNSVTLTVEELPELTLSATEVTLNCTTSTATITASGAYKYEWSYLDQTGATQTKSGSTLALQQTDPEVSSLVTEYTVYGYSENANCQSVEAKTVKVTEDFVKPVVDIKISETADGTIPERLDCYQQNIKLEADLTNNKETIVEYIWSSGSDNNTTLINNPGAYTLQVKGENGCISDVATETIEQNIVKPEVSIESYITDPVTGNIIPTIELTCANNEIILEGTITNADQYAEDYPEGEFTYLWSDGSTTSSTVAKTPLATSPMEYTLIVKSPNGCLNEVDKAKVTVTENVSAPVLNIESVYNLCPSDTLTETTLSSLLPNISGVTYKFYDESGEEIEDLYDASSADAITEYYVTGVSANGCESEKVSFAVDFAKNVDFTLTASQTSMLIGGNETVVTIVPDADSGEAETYTWLANGNEIAVDGLEYSTNLYIDTKFEVTATNRCDSKSQDVSIEVLWPTAFTPHNANGKNDDFAKGMPIIVFNRFYTKIFEGPDGWDGTINGTMNESEQIAVPGVYYYSVQLPNGEVKKGTIEIVNVD